MKTMLLVRKTSQVLFASFMIMLICFTSVSASSLEVYLDPILVRESLQRTYVFMVGQTIKNALFAFKKREERVATEKEFSSFTNQLLMEGKDPLVQRVDYVAEQRFIVVMRCNEFVEPQLCVWDVGGKVSGMKVVYNYHRETGQWILDAKDLIASSTTPTYVLLDIAMGIVTEYCLHPQDITQSPGMLSDVYWCQAWLEKVMPPPNLFEYDYFVGGLGPQLTYAFVLGQKVKNNLVAYKRLTNNSLSKEDFSWFTKQLLLLDGEINDPLIQNIEYIPEQSFTLIMHSNDVVVCELHGVKFVYEYSEDEFKDGNKVGQWEFARFENTSCGEPEIGGDATAPTSLLRDVGMALITEYCGGNPEGFQGGAGMLPDILWCPAWLQLVMPLP